MESILWLEKLARTANTKAYKLLALKRQWKDPLGSQVSQKTRGSQNIQCCWLTQIHDYVNSE